MRVSMWGLPFALLGLVLLSGLGCGSDSQGSAPDPTPQSTPETSPDATRDATPDASPNASPEASPEASATPRVTPPTTPEGSPAPSATPAATPTPTPDPTVAPDCACDTLPGCNPGCDCDAACAPLSCGPFVPALDSALSLGTLRDVQLSAPDRGWAVGSRGVILRLDDGGWRPVPSPVRGLLFALDLVDDQNGWAVGHEGEMARLNNGRWESFDGSDFNFSAGLQGIDLIDMQTGWVVGSGGIILQLREGQWQRVDAGIGGSSLRDVHLLDADNGWAVSTSGPALKLEDGVWREADDSVLNEGSFMNALHVIDADTAWGVGRKINALREGSWSNEVFSLRNSGRLQTLFLTDPDNGWALGWADAMRLRDGSWESGRCEGCSRSEMFGVHIVGDTGWAVGVRNLTTTFEGAVLAELRHGNGGDQRWQDVTPRAVSREKLTTIDLWDADNGWAGGEEGEVLRLQDGEWTQQEAGFSSDTVFEIALTQRGFGWAAMGGGRLFRLSSGFWRRHTDLDDFDGTHDVFGLALASDNAGWAVGHRPEGNLLVRLDGDSWTQVDAPGAGEPGGLNGETLFSVALSDVSNGWAVGGNVLTRQTLALQLSGGSWREAELDFPGTLFAVTLTDPDNGWAAGGQVNEDNDGGTPLLLRLRDGVWSEVEVDHPNTVLVDIEVDSAGLGWAVGLRGVVVALQPEGLAICQDGGLDVRTVGARPYFYRDDDLNAVSIAPDGTAWVAGDRGIRARTRVFNQ